jgi:hypothetical protein
MASRSLSEQLHYQIFQLIANVIHVMIPNLITIIRRHYLREPYHTSILTGQGWVDELLHGHPERIRTELGVHKHVFLALIQELREIGYGNTRYVSLEEQLAIFLYASVTGLTVRHLGEWFQRSNETISK